MLGYPDGLYQYIFYTSFFQLSHIYTGLKYKKYHCALMGVTLLGTSLNYWRHPLVNSWRRTIDMWVAHSTIAYHAYLGAFCVTNPLLCSSFIGTGSLMYPLSLIASAKGYNKLATTCHCLLHVLVSIGASTIYPNMKDSHM